MAWTINLTIADGENHTSIASFNFDNGLSIAQLDAIAPALASVVQDTIEGAVRKASVSRTLWESAAITPDAQSDVERGAMFIWNVSNTVKNVRNKIPTFPLTKIIPNTGMVDQSDTDVAAFIAAIENGISDGSTPQNVTDTEGRDINDVLSATEHYTKARK